MGSKPNLDDRGTTWILAEGAHHTVYSHGITNRIYGRILQILWIELLVIDDELPGIRDFKR